MAKITVDELMVKLDNLENIDLNKALIQSCLTVEEEAKRLCPVDTGQLKGSIHSTIHDTYGEVGTNVKYAPYVEYGTGLFAENGDGRKDVPWRYKDPEGNWHTTSGQKPQPYLQPALDNKRNEVLEIFKNTIKKGV